MWLISLLTNSTIQAALIGVAGTLGGVLVGSILARKSSQEAIDASNKNAVDIMQKEEFNRAAAKLRSAFAPAQAKMRLKRYSSGIELRDFFYDDISIHASAFEEFRPFIGDSHAYEKAWDEYEKTINYERYTNNEEYLWTSDVLETEEGISRFSEAITQKIDVILHFAPIK
jgi:hypothetical protein